MLSILLPRQRGANARGYGLIVDLWDILACITDRWSTGIGDPTVWGWVTVAAYAGAAALSLGASHGKDRREQGFWLMLAVAMLALAVNKQLDLQSALTAAGRCLSQAQGWYDTRRAVQTGFIRMLLLAGAILTVTALLVMRRHLRRLGPAILGLGLVVTFVAARAVGFHHVDTLIGLQAAGLRANPLFELPGIALIAANAAARLGRTRGRPARAEQR